MIFHHIPGALPELEPEEVGAPAKVDQRRETLHAGQWNQRHRDDHQQRQGAPAPLATAQPAHDHQRRRQPQQQGATGVGQEPARPVMERPPEDRSSDAGASRPTPRQPRQWEQCAPGTGSDCWVTHKAPAPRNTPSAAMRSTCSNRCPMPINATDDSADDQRIQGQPHPSIAILGPPARRARGSRATPS